MNDQVIDFSNIVRMPEDNENIIGNGGIQSDVEDISSNEFETLLNDLNKQVSNADGSVNELMRRKELIEQAQKELEAGNIALANDRAKFELSIKEEHQRLNDLRDEFEQEKVQIYNEIQETREALAKENREFEKYRQEQLEILKNNKKALAKNYEQFEQIVATFNEKIDNFH